MDGYPNPAQRRDWFSSQYEAADREHEPTDTELGGLAAAWHTSRADTTANPDRKDDWA